MTESKKVEKVDESKANKEEDKEKAKPVQLPVTEGREL